MRLDVDRVTSGYGNVTVLRDVSFSVGDGEVLGILGRNGMGKSTLIRTLSGLNMPTAGTIRLDGADITHMPPHSRARRGMTTIVQGRGIFPLLSVRENLEMGRIASNRGDRDRSAEVFEYFPRLAERLHQSAGTLSGGEQQMLAIGRGLMTNPNVILLDEPSDGIMPTLVQQITESLRLINANERTTILVVEQNVPMITRMTDHCIVLEKGRVVADGPTSEIVESDTVREHLAI
jgi:ABC-type branched-subunit amino acid transport system ATPase component